MRRGWTTANMWMAAARIGALTVTVLPLFACDAVVALFEPPQPPGPAFVLLLPERTLGWTCVDFGVQGAAGLAREGDAWVIDATAGSLIRTSSSPTGLLSLFPRDVVRVVNGHRVALEPGVEMRLAVSDIDSNDPIARHCLFYGTEQTVGSVGDAPALVRPKDDSCPVESPESARRRP